MAREKEIFQQGWEIYLGSVFEIRYKDAVKAPKSFSTWRLIATALLALRAISTSADTTWDGGAGTSAWSTAANWDPDGEPTSSLIAGFPAGPGGSITLLSGENAKGLEFYGPWTLSGGALTLAAAPSVFVDTAITGTLNTNTTVSSGELTKTGAGTLALGGSNSITGGVVISAGTLRASNASSLGAAGSVTTVSGSAILEIGGITLDRPITLLDGASLRGGASNSISNNIHTIDAGAAAITFATTDSSATLTVGNSANDLTGGNAGTVITLSGPGVVRLGAAANFAGSWSVPLGTRLDAGAAGAAGPISISGGSLGLRSSSAISSAATGLITVTADATLLSDRASAGAGLVHNSGSISMGSHTLDVRQGGNVTSGTAAWTTPGLMLTGNPTLDIESGTASMVMNITGGINAGGLARALTLSGNGLLAVTGGTTNLPAGSSVNSTAGGSLDLHFPQFTGDTTVSETQNPLGAATLSMTGGSLRFLSNATGGNSTAHAYTLGTDLTLAGTVQLDPNRNGGSNTNKTFILPSLALASGTDLEMGGDNTHGIRVSGAVTMSGPATLRGSSATGRDGLLTLASGLTGGPTDTLAIVGGTSPLALTILGASTYGGGTSIGGGTTPPTVTLAAANALGGGTVTIASGTVTVDAAGAIPGSISLLGGTLRANNPAHLSANTISASGGTLDFRASVGGSIQTGSLSLSGGVTLHVANNGSGSGQALTWPALAIAADTTLGFTTGNSYTHLLSQVNLAGNLTLDPTGVVRVTDITETLPGMKLLKAGTGTVELEGTGSYTGDTEVLGGILLIENAIAFGSGSLVIGATSGTTTATARFSPGLTITNPIVARSGSTGDVTLDADAGNVLWSGGVTLQRSLRLDNGSTTAPATVGGLISGTGNLVKVSNGEIVLANPANTFTGTLEIAAGSIAVATDGAFGHAANGISLSGTSAKLDITTSFGTARTITLGGSSAGINVAPDQTLVLTAPFAGAGPLVLDDTGIVEIGPSVDNSARASAATTISKGTLRISNPTAIGDGSGLVTLNGSTATLALLSDTGFAMAHPVTIGNSGGTIHVDRALAGSGIGGTHSIGNVSVASGALNVAGANGYGLQAGGYTASTTHTLQQNAPGGLVLASLTGASVTTNRTLTLTGDGSTTITGAITEVAGTGRWEIVKTGTGTFRFGSGIIGFNRALTVREGTVDLNGLTYAPESLVLGVNTSSNTATVRTSGGSLALAGTVSYTIGGLGFAAPPPSVIEGTIDLGALDREFAIANSSGATVELTADGSITGAAGLLKSGSGVLRLAGSTSNTFGGPLTMTSGTLELAKSSGNTIPAVGINSTGGTTRWLASNQVDDTATLAASSASSVTFDLNDQSDAVGGVSLTQTNGSQASILRTGETGTLTLLGNLTLANNTDTASTNARNVLVTGTGSRTSIGVSGTLNLGGGTRTIHVTTTTVGANAVNAGATIETAIVNGGIIKSGPQPLVLGHPANTFSGGLQINEGTVRAGQAGSLGTGPVVFSQSGAVDAALVVSGVTGEFAGDVTIGGGGSGATILRCDALPPQVVTFSGNLDLEKDLTVDVVYGSTRGSSSTTLDLTGQIDDGAFTAGLVKTGEGILKLAAGNTYSGPTSIELGTLVVGAASAFGDGISPVSIDGGCLEAVASFTLARDIACGTAGATIKVDDQNVLGISGSFQWSDDATHFFGNGATLLTGTTPASSGDIVVGFPGGFAPYQFDSSIGLGHVLSLRGSAQLTTGNLRLLEMGVLELGNGDFTRSPGDGPGEVLLDTGSGGGFAAHGADRTVNLGGAGATMIWGDDAPVFLRSSSGSVGDLVLGAFTATHTVIFANPLELDNGDGGFYAGILVNDGAAAVDARITGAISHGAAPNPSDYRALYVHGEGTLAIEGDISGQLHLDFQGPGDVRLSGTNTQSGDISIESGVVELLSTDSLGSPLHIHIGPTATLDASVLATALAPGDGSDLSIFGLLTGSASGNGGIYGSGTITGNLQAQSGAYVYPDVDGVLSINGDFAISAGAQFEIFVDGPVGGTGHGQMSVGGVVTLGGDLTIYNGPDLDILLSGPIFPILNAGSDPITGTFDGLPEGALYSLGNGFAFQISYAANGDGGPVGNDLSLTLVPDILTPDLALSATTDLLVAQGTAFSSTWIISNQSGETVEGASVEFILPGNATFNGSSPAGTLDAGVLTVALPSLPDDSTTVITLDFTAPGTTSSVLVQGSILPANDTDPANNSATVLTAVNATGTLQLSTFQSGPGAGEITLGIDTIDGVTYGFERSDDLSGWTELFRLVGDGSEWIEVMPTTEPREFFRFSIQPFENLPGGPSSN